MGWSVILWTSIFVCLFTVSCGGSEGSKLVVTPSGDVEIKIGHKLRVVCEVKGGEETPNLFWVKIIDNYREEQVALTGSVRVINKIHSLMLDFVKADYKDGGEYKCIDRDTGESEKITVYIKPTLTYIDVPTEQNPIVKETAVIKCPVESGPGVVITWTKNNTAIVSDGRYVAANNTLTIPNFEKDLDDGNYTCDAHITKTGDFGERTIAVIGHFAPTSANLVLIDNDKWKTGVHEGAKNVRLSCSANGFPAPTIKWFKENTELVDDHYNRNVSGILEIKQMRPDDAGTYRCVAANSVGERDASLEINVFEKPTIDKIKLDQDIRVDEDVSVTCRYNGSGDLHAVWLYGGNTISQSQESGKHFIIEGNSAILHLKKVQFSDAGEYQCHVTNDAGLTIGSVKLQVNRAPYIVDSTAKIRGTLNSQFRLHCEVLAKPASTIYWFKDSTQLTDIPGKIKIQPTEEKEENHYTSEIAILATSEQDFGNYLCKATNDLGGDERKIEVIKIESPLRPMIDCVQDVVKATIVTLHIPQFSSLEPENRWPTSLEIHVTRKWNNTPIDPISVKFDTFGSYKIPKLEPSTAYLFNVTGRNEVGESPWSIVECATSKPSPPGIPVFMTPGAIYCNSTRNCLAEWTLHDDTGGKPVQTYEIRISSVNENDTMTSYTMEPRAQWLDLKPNSQYKLSVRARNDEGWGEAAETVIITGDDITGNALTTGHMDTGAVIGIVIIVALIILCLVDMICYFTNRSGVTAWICVRCCGKESTQRKGKEEKLTTVVTKTTKTETVVEVNTSESEVAPMIPQEKPKTTSV